MCVSTQIDSSDKIKTSEPVKFTHAKELHQNRKGCDCDFVTLLLFMYL